jgi:hypothetical protein
MMTRLLSKWWMRGSHGFINEFDQTIYGDSGYGGSSGFASKQNIANAKIRPATLAVLVQCMALLCVMSIAWSVYFFTPRKLSGVALALSQAAVAASLSYIFGMAVWWRWIHLLFPLAIWSLSQWQISSDVYFYGFLVTLSLFWTTFRTQVPFYPSRAIVHEQVAELVPQNKSIRMIDIGSGLGDLVMHVAKHRVVLNDKKSEITGIEIAPLPWFLSKVRAYFKRSTAHFKLGNYESLNFADFDVIFAYLSPAAMTALWQKAHLEMRKGSMLMSYEFEIIGVKPSFQISGINGSPTLYVWKM